MDVYALTLVITCISNRTSTGNRSARLGWGKIGPWWVVALIILTGMAGVTIAKQQGAATWYQAKRDMYAGKVPTIHILNGICIFIGGVFLFTPGFITDIVGFILVLPWTRRF